MRKPRWNHHTNEWEVYTREGTQIHSHSYRVVEDLLDQLDNPSARRRENVANAVAVVTAATIILAVTAVAAWLW
jgi:hypothetical protein